MTFWKILCGIAIGIAIIGWLFWGVQSCTDKKTIASVIKQRDSCWNAPVTVHDSITHDTIHDTLWRKPDKKLVYDTIHDTVPAKWCKQLFTGTYRYQKGKKTGVINYEIADKDCNPLIRFPLIDLPVDSVTITNTIDTCYKPSIVKLKPEYELNVGPGYEVLESKFSLNAEGGISLGHFGLRAEGEFSIEKHPQLGVKGKIIYKFVK